jgi:hypothetical protein
VKPERAWTGPVFECFDCLPLSPSDREATAYCLLLKKQPRGDSNHLFHLESMDAKSSLPKLLIINSLCQPPCNPSKVD